MMTKLRLLKNLVSYIFICLSFTVFLSFTDASERLCGRNVIRKPKIQGGKDAFEGEFPWLVSIRFAVSQAEIHHLCGGSLLTNKFILTAAHCMQYKALKFMSVSTGEFDLKKVSSNEQIRTIGSVYIHEKFGTKDIINDIAIVELTEPVLWTNYVLPICLPNSSDDGGHNSLDNQMMMVVGWGSTNGKSNWKGKSAILQKTKVPIVNLNICQKWYEQGTAKLPGDPQHVSLLESSHICAGYEMGTKDFCLGDSGGPLMKIDATGRKVVVGVVSAGIGCGRPKTPGIYTRIVNYIPWIFFKITQ